MSRAGSGSRPGLGPRSDSSLKLRRRVDGRRAPTRMERAGRRAAGELRAAAPILITLLVLFACIAYLNPRFLDPLVFLAFLRRAAPLMVLAAGQAFVIIAGGFDLSVGSLITVSVVIAARISGGDPALTVPVIVLLFVVGAAVGLVNGLVTTKLRVPSFITTLGMLLILQGAVFYWTGGSPRGALAPNFRAMGRGGIEGVPLIGQIPYGAIVVVVVGAFAIRALHGTTFGQELYAAGGGARAAALSGVNIDRVRTIAFVLSGLSAALAGVLLGGFAGVSAQVGEGYEFRAISAVVLGGAALGGGSGSMIAVLAGALTLEALFTLLNLLGFPQPIRETVQGLIIIGAVAFAAHRARRGR